jgi:hypothetical protein
VQAVDALIDIGQLALQRRAQLRPGRIRFGQQR